MTLQRTRQAWLVFGAALLLGCGLADAAGAAEPDGGSLAKIETVVVIYAENRSFDNLYGDFPGADGLQSVTSAEYLQRDRDGRLLPELPTMWNGLTAKGVVPVIAAEDTRHLPNRPFAIDDPRRFHLSPSIATMDLVHRFYQNQMQIDGGKNDKFAAYSDDGALTMGHYHVDEATLPLWSYAKRFVLADHFFMGAFGGSFLNHQYLICACAPVYPLADQGPAKGLISAVNPDGVSLRLKDTAPGSALDGPPSFVNDGTLTPDFHAVNTMEPPYQPSRNRSATDGDPRFADPDKATTLPPQTAVTIGDLLSAKGLDWAWYAGAWQWALDGWRADGRPNFQSHHQPFNYYARYAPGTAERAAHLRDGGLDGAAFLKDIDEGHLPTVSFYKPQGNLDEHSGYADVVAGDRHIAELLRHLEHGPQWAHMLVIVTYDENGGYWDHVPPPAGDRWGPGSRVPALILSPFAKPGFVDHTVYDTGSIARFLSKRFDLPLLPGIADRDAAVAARQGTPFGDLTNALLP